MKRLAMALFALVCLPVSASAGVIIGAVPINVEFAYDGRPITHSCGEYSAFPSYGGTPCSPGLLVFQFDPSKDNSLDFQFLNSSGDEPYQTFGLSQDPSSWPDGMFQLQYGGGILSGPSADPGSTFTQSHSLGGASLELFSYISNHDGVQHFELGCTAVGAGCGGSGTQGIYYFNNDDPDEQSFLIFNYDFRTIKIRGVPAPSAWLFLVFGLFGISLAAKRKPRAVSGARSIL